MTRRRARPAGRARPARASSRARSASLLDFPERRARMGARRARARRRATSPGTRASRALQDALRRRKLIGLRRERRQVRLQGAHRRAAGDRQDCRVAGERSPDDWLRLLGPVAEFDRQADAVREGGGGFFARRFARKHDVPNGLRSFALPLTADPARGPGPGEAARALDRPDRRRMQPQQARPHEPAVQEGRLPQGRRHLLRRPVAPGPRALRRRRRRALRGHRPRALLEQDQAQPARQDQAQGQEQEEDRAERHALRPGAQLRGRAPARGRDVPKETVKPGESRTTVKLSGTMEQPNVDAVAADPDAARADLGRLRARRAGAQEEAVTRVRRPRPVRVQARVLHAARLRERRGHELHGAARGGSARSTWRRAASASSAPPSATRTRADDPERIDLAPTRSAVALPQPLVPLERLRARVLGHVRPVLERHRLPLVRRPGRLRRLTTTAAASATPEPLRALWLTETYPPQPRRDGAVVRPDRARAAPARRARRRPALHAAAARAAVGDRDPGGRALPRVPGRGRPGARAQPRLERARRPTRPRYTHVVAFGGSRPIMAGPVFAAWLGVPLITLIRGNDFDAAVFSHPPPADPRRGARALARWSAPSRGTRWTRSPRCTRARTCAGSRTASTAPTGSSRRATARQAAEWRGDAARGPPRARPVRPAEGQEGRRLPARRAAALRRRRPLPPAARGLDGARHGGVAGRARARAHRRCRSWTATSCCRGTRRATGSRSRPSTTGCRTCWPRRRRSACRWSPRAPAGWPTCSTTAAPRSCSTRATRPAARGRCSARRGSTRSARLRDGRGVPRAGRDRARRARSRSTATSQALDARRARPRRAARRDPLLRARRRARPPHAGAQGARGARARRTPSLLTAARASARDPRVTGGAAGVTRPAPARPRPRRVPRLAARRCCASADELIVDSFPGGILGELCGLALPPARLIARRLRWEVYAQRLDGPLPRYDAHLRARAARRPARRAARRSRTPPIGEPLLDEPHWLVVHAGPQHELDAAARARRAARRS